MTNAGALDITTPTDLEILTTRVFDAPRRLVFEAWTNPEYLPHWMLGPDGWTMTACDVDLRRGGTWHFAWRHTDGREMSMHGVYREVVPPERLVFTEVWGGNWPETLNTNVLTEANGKTTMKASMRYPTKDARDTALKSGMKDGMAISSNRLAALLGTRS